MADETGGKIRKLAEAVINRIAAGEVIQRPANALKELIENSLDAGSTSIQVTVKQGGLKLLQVQDDGCGIHADDLMIACERFTTSKLRTYQDLTTIATHGFRGEALASMSHVAHLTLVSKTPGARCAFKARYQDGRPIGIPQPCAGNTGTRITLEDLFYNVATRRNALRSPSDEFGRLADVCSKYAVHNATKVAFSLKRQGENVADVRTSAGSSVQDTIRSLYGSAIARELVEVESEEESLGLKLKAHVTNANYSAKKATFILFINERLVDCSPMKKALDKSYEAYLPRGGHPFIYLALSLSPENVDVNVHPTKQEVLFLHEESIIEAVQRAIETRLQDANVSRTFYTQALLPGAAIPTTSDTSAKVYDNKLVRTDSQSQKLDKFFGGTASPSMTSSVSSSQRRDVNLTSVLQLRKEVEDSCHQGLRDLFKMHTFVGCVDQTRALVQHQTRLYLCNTELVTMEVLYQLVMYEFGNMGYLNLSEPAPVQALIQVALNQEESGWTEEDGPKDELSDYIHKFMIKKASMLDDYFSLKIDSEGNLVSIPMIIDNYVPPLERLPMYILRLATEVDWEGEKECFHTFATETARFYAQLPLDLPSEEKDAKEDGGGDKSNSTNWKWTVEHVMYPACKHFLLPPKKFADDGTLLQIADLPDLYKVFERC